jgi:putative transposase
MHTVSYSRHRFPAEVIQHAVWLYFRFPLSFRDVEDLLSHRGVDVSYETVRRWSVKFGLAYARKLRHSHPRADVRWHLDEVFVRINGKCVYLWRAVDCEGQVSRFSSTICLNTCCDLQYFQRPTPSDLTQNIAPIPS